MGGGLKLVGVVLVCIVLTACGKSAEEKVLAETDESLTHQEKAELEKALDESSKSKGFHANGPKCEKRDSKGAYIVPGGCTHADMKAWRERGSPDEL